MKKLIAQDFHFYPNGEYKSIRAQDSQLNSYYTDIEETSRSIRIFGTEEQIDKALNDYTEQTGLALDECYNFKVEPKGSYWYNIFGDEAESINKKTQEKLDKYKKLYEEQKVKKPIIINLI
jgi:hypothetical protein